VETPAQPGTANQEAFTNLEGLMAAGDWEEAISAISNFQHDFPDEKRRETDEMLYNAYVNLGVKLVSGSQIELGLFYLTQAERLGDLPIEVQDQRTWAKLYLDGIGYYGVNWEAAIFYFRGLCAAAPFYQDACQKLFEAYAAFGDQYASGLDWCPAEEWYIEAIRLDNSEEEVIDKRREATTNCLEATPTPEAPITDTVPITNTVPFSNTLPSVSPTETAAP
jgi:tetratricopeptide (TPR) repeat protein